MTPCCAGGDVAPPQQQEGQRKPERRNVKIVFYANGVFTGACAALLGGQERRRAA